jgi:drug/metabolite transporter (DMT)-like permease
MPATGTKPFQPSHALGVVLALAGGTMLSFGGPIVRMFEDAGGWTIMFYRGLAFFATLFAIVCWRSRGRVLERYRQIDRIGLAIALCLGIGLIAYVFAMLNTTVANVTFVIGASPLATAVLAWLVLNERISLTSALILCMAVFGVGIMVVEGISAGRLTGNLIALGAVATYAVFIILLRKARDFDMLAATSLAGLVASAIGFCLAETLAISTHDLMVALIFGSVQIGLGFTFVTYASRHIPAAEVTLLTLSETVLGPIWAWLLVGEVPSVWTLVGGAVVLGCVALFAARALAESRHSGVTA